MASAFYQYSPLTSENAFRLFRVTKCPLPTDREIEIELFEVSLDEPPPFEAVSYAWGGGEKDRTLVCGGYPLPVSATVVDFLIALDWQHFIECWDLTEPKTLWIDAICINQASVEEKNAQVPRMRTIYHEADQVWVWLGTGTVETNIAFDYLSKKYTLGESGDLFTDSVYKNAVVRKRGFYDAVDTDFIVDVVNLPWFGRTWTVQELLLSKSATLLCGSMALSWLAFTSILSAIQSKARSRMLCGFPILASNPVTFYDDISCYHAYGCTVKAKSISAALTLVRRKEATEPKDKVYGLYGILEHANLPRIDYDYTVQRIYTEIAVTSLQSENSLEVLHQTCLQPLIPHLPSWVPDWSNSAFIQPLPRKLTTGRSPFIQFKGCHLSIVGRMADTVCEVANSTSICSDNFRRGWSARKSRGSPAQRHAAVTCLVHTLQAWVKLGLDGASHETSRESPGKFSSIAFSVVPNRYGFGLVRFNNILQTLVSIVLADSRKLNHLHQNVRSHDSYHGVVSDYRELFGLSANINEWSDELIKRLVLRLHSPEISELQHDISLITYQRTLFTTRHGYMGIGPRWMKRGDSVVIFSGHNAPFVVGEANEYYQLLGPAYIDGMMDGELWDDEKAQQITLV